jgi:hypothetical protein
MDFFQIDSVTWAMVSSWAAVVGVIVSAVTFKKSFSKMKKSEQIRIVHDIRNDLTRAENNILESVNGTDEEDAKNRAIQYLNVCEWYALLVNKDQITMQELKDHYAPKMLKACDIFDSYSDLKEDESKFKELKSLCKRLRCENG